MAKFNGISIFGAQVRQNGPIPKRRAQREELPGVKGYREYDLSGSGPDTRTWTIRGRLVALSLKRLQDDISLTQTKIGTFGRFEETGGTVWRNCQLIDFRPAGEFRKAQAGGILVFTCEVSGTIETAGG